MNKNILGINCYYEIFGNAPRKLLILHGWGNDISTWKSIIKSLEKYYTVYALDLPSHGGSDKIPKNSGLIDYANFVEAFMKEMDIEGADVLAHSFGGRIAIYLASQNPSIFNSLILTGCAGLTRKKTRREKRRGFAYRIKKAFILPLTHLPFVGEKFKPIFERLRKKYNSSDYMALSEDMKQTFVNIIRKDLSKYLPLIKNKTLLIYGENDSATPLWMAEKFHSGIEKSELHIMPGDHYCFIKHPSVFLDYVFDFVLEVDND